MVDAITMILVLDVLWPTCHAPMTVTRDREFDLFAIDVEEGPTGIAIKVTQAVGIVRGRLQSAAITPLSTAEHLDSG